MKRGTFLHALQNIMDVASKFSELYAGPMQKSSIPDLGSRDVKDRFQLYQSNEVLAVQMESAQA